MYRYGNTLIKLLLLLLSHIASHWLTLVSSLQFMCLGKPIVKRYWQIVNNPGQFSLGEMRFS